MASASTLKTLSGENCRLVPAKAEPVPGAIRADAALSCGGRIIGNVASMQVPGINLSGGAAGQQALTLAAGQLRQFLAPQRAYDCEPAKPVPAVAKASVVNVAIGTTVTAMIAVVAASVRADIHAVS